MLNWQNDNWSAEKLQLQPRTSSLTSAHAVTTRRSRRIACSQRVTFTWRDLRTSSPLIQTHEKQHSDYVGFSCVPHISPLGISSTSVGTPKFGKTKTRRLGVLPLTNSAKTLPSFQPGKVFCMVWITCKEKEEKMILICKQMKTETVLFSSAYLQSTFAPSLIFGIRGAKNRRRSEQSRHELRLL